MKRILVFSLLLVFTLPCIYIPHSEASGLANSAWPCKGHDSRHTGRSPYIGAQTNTLKWKYQTGSDIYSSPAIDIDGTIYIGSNDGKIYALHPNGTLKWSYQTGDAVYSSPAISSEGTIYVGSLDGKLYALNPDGTLKWSYQTIDKNQNFGLIYSSPVIGDDGTVYIASDSNGIYVYRYLYALNPENGALKWKYDGCSYTPAIGTDGTIYLAGVALDPNGIYKFSLLEAKTCKPFAIGDDGTIYGGCGNEVHAYTPDGIKKWEYESFVDKTLFSSPAIGVDGTIYIGLYNSVEHGKFCAFNPDGNLKWSYQIRNGVRSAPALGADGTIYVGGDDGIFYAFDPNGILQWSYSPFRTGGSSMLVVASPAIGPDGTIYIENLDGELCAFVTTEDNEAPEIICPSDMIVSFTGVLTPVNYEATVTDNINPYPVVVYAPASGFPLGATIVTVTATDYAGNSSECNLSVTKIKHLVFAINLMR